jgi:DDE superfamily endonuclease
MLTVSLPDTLTTLLAGFAPCFTAPTLRTFQALVAGFLAQPGLRTVTGMLVGARLAGQRHHDLAYRFFASALWSADQFGLVLLDLITSTLIPAGAPLLLAVDDTLWRRSGPTLHGAAWHHDGNGPGRHRPAWGHRWVVVGAIAHLPFVTRAVCLPILARLWIPGDSDHTPLILARELVDLVVHHVGDHPLHLVGDAAYIGKPLQALPAQVTVTARLRCDAALYAPPPLHTGRRGRPRVKGDRLPELIMLAGMTRYRWTPVQVRCYGKTLDREVLAIRCLWYGALKGQLVQVVLSRPVGAPDSHELALVTTDLAATPAAIIERYADRWSEEMSQAHCPHTGRGRCLCGARVA